jgi:hypothetical protein
LDYFGGSINMDRIKNKWLWGTGLVLLLLAAGGATFNTAHALDNLVATLSVNSRNITVGDVISLTLRVTHPAGWRVIFPALDKQWGDFEVRGQDVPEIVSNPDGTQTTIQELKVVRMRPGEVQTPALTLSVADDQGNLNSLEVAPVPISVSSVLVEGDTNLRAIKPQAELVSEGRPYWPIATAGLLGAATLTGYGVQRWRHRKLVDRRTPRQRTLDSLAALSAQNPQTPAEIKAHGALLADCLRDYMAAITHLPARDLTTRELARRFKDQEVPPEWSAQVVEILQVCDGVKFANEELDGQSLLGMIASARRLVEQYPPQPQPAQHRSGHKKQKAGIA